MPAHQADGRPPSRDVDPAIDQVLDDYEVIVRCAAEEHTPQFLALDVTMSQAKVLYLLSLAPGRRMSDIAARLRVSLPTVSGVVERLVEHGLVLRREDPLDRRQVMLSLTSAGTEVIDRFREVHHEHLRDLLQNLGAADLAALARGIAALAAAARQPRPAPPVGGRRPPDSDERATA